MRINELMDEMKGVIFKMSSFRIPKNEVAQRIEKLIEIRELTKIYNGKIKAIDEPTWGLDPIMRKNVLDTIKAYKIQNLKKI